VWPQWQGAGTESVRSLAPEFPFDIGRRGYSVGTKVLQAVLPEHAGPTAVVPVEMGDIGLEERDGIEAKAVVLQQLRSDTGATKVAIHFDVDTVDADEIQLGLGADLGGLPIAEARRVVADIDGAAEVVGLTIAEFIPRQVMHLQQILAGFPLLGPRA